MTAFINVLTGQPPAIQAAGAEVGTAASQIQQLASALQSGMNIASWTGPASDAQRKRVLDLIGLFQRLLASMAQVQATTQTGAAQMQAAKMQTTATVAAAQAGRYQVFPTGTVQPGPWHYAFAHTHPGAMGIFKMIAGQLTAQINASVAQSTSADAKVAATVAQAVLQYLADWLDKRTSGSSTNAATAPTTVPGGTSTLPSATSPGPGTSTSTNTSLPGTDPGAATTLAGAGAFGSSLGGAAGLQLGPGAGVPGAPTGLLGGGAAGVPVAGVAGAPGAATRGAAGAVPMAHAGHGAAAERDAERRATADWLVEDGEPWGPGDAPDPVVT